MKDHSVLIESVKNSGNEFFWLGASSGEQIEILENALNLQLPNSFKDFLKKYGGGGVIEAEVSGIEDNDALNDAGGTVYGDTLAIREDYDLPEKLAVIFFREDEICWCIDARSPQNSEEFPIVSYNLITRKIDNKISDSFEAFFEEYLTLRSQS